MKHFGGSLWATSVLLVAGLTLCAHQAAARLDGYLISRGPESSRSGLETAADDYEDTPMVSSTETTFKRKISRDASSRASVGRAQRLRASVAGYEDFNPNDDTDASDYLDGEEALIRSMATRGAVTGNGSATVADLDGQDGVDGEANGQTADRGLIGDLIKSATGSIFEGPTDNIFSQGMKLLNKVMKTDDDGDNYDEDDDERPRKKSKRRKKSRRAKVADKSADEDDEGNDDDYDGEDVTEEQVSEKTRLKKETEKSKNSKKTRKTKKRVLMSMEPNEMNIKRVDLSAESGKNGASSIDELKSELDAIDQAEGAGRGAWPPRRTQRFG